MSDTSHRRERLRERTLIEIKDLARTQLVASGPAAISLRAIAREMGMTAAALYRYVPALDALVIELCTDLHNEVRIACEAARDADPDPDPLRRLLVMARELRRWALAHRPEATLIFGPPLPGVEQFHQQCDDLQCAGAQLGQIFVEPLLELWQAGRLPQAPHVDLDRLAGALPAHGELPIEVTAVFLTSWIRLYGVLAAELFGQLTWAATDTEPLFEAELAAFAAQIPPAAPAPSAATLKESRPQGSPEPATP
ncbi:TetR/AcrR family transcriptional regulator [Catellatospora citrea]|uniref:TetR family transcriptional regulator n=1 Tax=Catellatospora citrea TaxID=53366 RepID=A0A8J3KJF7_9ACTN|nr:TetR/AcrR family transcriptional regulator [Catellatospora citrea]RKE09955.1 TetR family transcriptional regulator [Catellatospora citrea]GIG02000.1 TetR family transcriptional regulator [Catellatospora citrea]